MRLTGLAVAVLLTTSATAYPPSSSDHARESISSFSDYRPGDIVFRRGHDVTSHLVLVLDPASRYSHVGIVAESEGVSIVHAAPAEGPDERDGVRVQSLAAFLAPARASAVAVFRLDDAAVANAAEVARRAAQVAVTIASHRPGFDGAFDLRSRDRYYCTELVWQAFREAGVNLVPRFDVLSVPLLSRDVILPSTLKNSPTLKRVYPILPAPPS